MRWILLFALAACTKTSDTDVVDTDTEADTDTDTDSDTDVDTDLPDYDNDGSPSGLDCNDQDPSVFPGAEEICNGRDDDCDGENDDGVTVTSYADVDGDGYGTPGTATTSCEIGAGRADNDQDCSDGDASVNPGMPELCDGIDSDCLDNVESGALFIGYSSLVAEDLTATWAAGTAAAPVDWSPSEAGAVMICLGPWYVAIDTAVSLDIYSLDGADRAILSGGGTMPVLRVRGKGTAVSVAEVTLEDGAAVESASWYPDGAATFGGNIWCEGKNSVSISGSIIRGGTATGGAGIYASGCPIEIESSTLEGNVATTNGGAILALDAALDITGSVITGNDGGTFAGGITSTTFGAGGGKVTLIDTEISGNIGDAAGGLFAENTPVVCEGSATTAGGFFKNESYGVYISAGATFEAKSCDFGREATDEDNLPADIRWDTSSMNADNDQSFTCDSGSGCSP